MPVDLSHPKLKELPAAPGCYLFKNAAEDIIYVGKAKVLKNRVRSYFQKGSEKDRKTALMVPRIEDIDWIVTDSEVDALILEANLVKEHRPKFNIDLKDDKSFPYIRITNEPYPQVFLTRTVVKDGSKYLGPFTNVKKVREALKVVKKIFSIRSCSYRIDEDFIKRKKVRLCLDYHIKKCDGPCEGLVSPVEYSKMVRQVVEYLNGKTKGVVEYLTSRMQEASERQDFEDAARYRDQLFAVKRRAQKQRVEFIDAKDRDFVSLARKDDHACAVVFRVRDGKLIGQEHFFVNGVDEWEESVVMGKFLTQYYSTSESVPNELFTEHKFDEAVLMSEWLSLRKGGKVRVVVPKKGNKKSLLGLAKKNARLHLDEFLLNKIARADYVPKSLAALQEDLGLEKLPRRIEAFDISNIQGKDAVGVMVCFLNAMPKKSEYRRYKIKSVEGPDDFAMMREVVLRRYRRVIEEDLPLPDLILIDGGKGQLSAAVSVLANLDLLDQEVVGLAKRLEEVFKPGLSDPQSISKTSPGIRLLRRVRDETHRFAIEYHRNLRRKRTLRSELDGIAGIGPHRKMALLRHFKSLKKVKEAGANELAQVPGISEKLATSIHEQLNCLRNEKTVRGQQS